MSNPTGETIGDRARDVQATPPTRQPVTTDQAMAAVRRGKR
jgi:hypothetical protein